MSKNLKKSPKSSKSSKFGQKLSNLNFYRKKTAEPNVGRSIEKKSSNKKKR